MDSTKLHNLQNSTAFNCVYINLVMVYAESYTTQLYSISSPWHHPFSLQDHNAQDRKHKTVALQTWSFQAYTLFYSYLIKTPLA